MKLNRKLKVCFFGLGSIGQRHVKNLVEVCEAKGIIVEIHAFRKGMRKLPRDIASLVTKQYTNEAEVDKHYDAIFITNPTCEHFNSLKKYKKYSSYFFIEKPVFDHSQYNLDVLQLASDTVTYVAAPLRFSLVMQYMKKITERENVIAVRSICSSYLPDWRVDTDYRTCYSAIKELGGGVKADLIHEWDYLIYLFGFPQVVHSLFGKYSNLEINSEDLAIYIASYRDKLVELHLDYFGRSSQRTIECFTDKYTITGDFYNSRIDFSNELDSIVFEENPNDKYVREMEYFISLCCGVRNNDINDIAHALNVLKITEGNMD